MERDFVCWHARVRQRDSTLFILLTMRHRSGAYLWSKSLKLTTRVKERLLNNDIKLAYLASKI